MPSIKLAFNNSRPPEERGALGAAELLGKSEEQENKFKRLLEWHGIPTTKVNDEFIGNCPFQDCPSFIEQKPGKFTCHCQTMQWRCFVCGRTGNQPTFIRHIHRNSLEQTTEAHLQQLRTARRGALDLVDLKDMQVALNPLTHEWSLPAWNMQGEISNLYIWREEFNVETGKKMKQIRSSPCHKQILYGLNFFHVGNTSRAVIIVEGHWDYICLRGLLRRLNKLNLYDIIAVPGAGTFPKEFLHLLGGRKVYVMMDNDSAGQAATDSLINNIAKTSIITQALYSLEWPAELKQGFDISDAYTSLPQKLRTGKEVKE